MMNFAQLIALAASHRESRVLTVYLDGTATDPAQQRSWRVQLDLSLDNLRTWLIGSDHSESEAFEPVRSAIDQGASIEEVSGKAAAQLDAHGAWQRVCGIDWRPLAG